MSTDTPPKPVDTEAFPIESNDDIIRGLFVLMGRYSSSEGFKKLKTLDKDVEMLRREVIDLRITNKRNLEGYLLDRGEWDKERDSLITQLKDHEDRRTQELRDSEEKRNQEMLARQDVEKQLEEERAISQNQRDEISGHESSIQKLIDQTKGLETEINMLVAKDQEQKDVIDKELKDKAELQEELKRVSEQLDKRTDRLSEVLDLVEMYEGFAVQLSPLNDKKAQVQGALADMFNSSLDYFERSLGQDVEPEVLMRNVSQDFASSRISLPLPATNTNDARRMRIVAGLMAFGKALANHVFRPTLITRDHELDGVLHLTGGRNPSQETYIRSVLLKAIPERHQQNEQESVDLVTKAVLAVVGQWLLDEATFVSGLRSLCDRATKTWALVQYLEAKVWLDFSFRVPDDWVPVPFPASQAPPATACKPGNHKPMPPQKKSQGQQGDLSKGGPKSNGLSKSDVARVVWPAFLVVDCEGLDDDVDPTQDELLYQGYVLTQAQIRGAEDEAAESLQRSPPRPRKRRTSVSLVSNGSLTGSTAT